ncbi:hypothetical protein IJD44_00535 [bacterium]|nr:hypothetical protein [bacterium]
MNINCVNKLLKAVDEGTFLRKDTWTINRTYHSIGCAFSKKWVADILPSELLVRSIKQSVEAIATLSEGEIFYEHFPDNIQTPNYGDNWGRFANYIELNDRAIAYMYNNRSCCGILGCIKLLPAIPPSARSWANCLIISQIFPNIYGDGYNKDIHEENSIYGIKLNTHYSENIVSYGLVPKITAQEQIQAFNDLSHFRGIKTGFRTVLSADQIKIVLKNGNETTLDWHNSNHTELYINEHVKLINLGFDCIFFDSAKHVGGYEMHHYEGVGNIPSYEQMQYILHEIRKRSHKGNLSFIGEKCFGDHQRYQQMGLNAGSDCITGDDFFAVKALSDDFKYSRIYAPGVEIENDNYYGGITYEQRLHRINTALFAFTYASDKLPSFMQTNDIFPLRYDSNTHHIMMANPSYSEDGSIESHWENLFAKDDGRFYNHKVAELFAHALCL